MPDPTSETKEEAYSRLKTEAKQIKSDLVEDLPPSDRSREEIRDRLYRMIDYAISRHDWYDEQRYRFLRIGLGVTAAASALASLLANVSGSINPAPLVAFTISVLFLLGTGVTLIIVYNKSVFKDHPYRRISDIRSWYFIYNHPENMTEEISNKKSEAIKEANDVKDNLESFVKGWMEYAKDKKGFIKEDIEQVFILHLLQRYKYQQVKQLSKYLTIGITISSIVFGIGIILFFTTAEAQSTTGSDNGVDSTDKKTEMIEVK